MAVTTTVTSANFTGTGVSSSYAPGFYVNSSAQVVVTVNGVLKTLGVDYSVNNVGNAAGCNVVGTFTAGAAVLIKRVTAITQLVDTQNNETILEDVLDAEFDKLTMIAQEIDAAVDRALLFPEGDAGIGALPTVAQRLGCTLAFNATTGRPEVGPNVASVGTVAAAVAAISTVSSNIASVNTVSTNIADVVAVGGSIASVNTAAANIAAITAAPGYASTASTAATNAGNSATAAAASASSATNAPGTSATSTSSLTIGTGSKSFNLVETGKAFSLGQWMTVANTPTPTNYMTGQITAFNSGTGAMTITVASGATGGTGTFSAWTISLAAQPGTASALPTSGGTMTGLLTTVASASGGAGLNVPHGADPTSPVNGDLWSTTAGLKFRANGVTQLLGSGGGSPITSSSAQAFAVGQNGNTNPAFNVDASTASSATGITVKSAAAGGGVTITATSSNATESLTINPKGSTILALGNTANAVNIGSSGAGNYVQTTTLYLAANNGNTHPLRFSQNSLIASPSVGGMEFGTSYCFYASPENGQRGVVDVKTLAIQQAAYTLTSQTAAQKAFNVTTNGQVQLAVGTYEIEALISLSSMSATSGSFGFALGGTATFTQNWMAEANKVATLATAAAPQTSINTAANTALATANTNTNGYMKITGTIVVTVAGTVIPQVSLGVAAAASVNIGSYCKFKKIGSTSDNFVGAWT